MNSPISTAALKIIVSGISPLEWKAPIGPLEKGSRNTEKIDFNSMKKISFSMFVEKLSK